MSDPQINIGVIARRMLGDYDAVKPGTFFGEGLRLTLGQARQVQNAVADLRLQRGEQVVGYKIGCVCAGNQQRQGLPHPVWGRLWSTEQRADGARLSRSGFANVAIEGEFAVTLGRDLDPHSASLAAIAAAVDRVATVIELHNLIFRGDDPKGHELIANNAIHAGVVSGPGVAKPDGAATTDLSIRFDGQLVDQWTAIRWPDDILQAVAWLIEQLAGHGLRLHRGQTILTGALGPPLPVDQVRHVEVSSSRFGRVAALFE